MSTHSFLRCARTSLAIFGWAALIIPSLRAQSAPPAPPTPPAPPSATIPTPGVPQYTPMPMIEMNAPFGAAGTTPTAGALASGATTAPGSSVMVIPTLPSTAPATPAPSTVLPAGTPLLLSVQHALHLRTARVGDPVYLRTKFPVAAGHHVAIPAGSYVQGTLIAVRSYMANIRLMQLLLPNGSVVAFPNAPSPSCTILLRTATGLIPRGRSIDTCLPHALRLPAPPAQQAPATSSPTIPVPILVQPPAFSTNSFPATGTAASAPFIKK